MTFLIWWFILSIPVAILTGKLISLQDDET
jgi:hypothetical protein